MKLMHLYPTGSTNMLNFYFYKQHEVHVGSPVISFFTNVTGRKPSRPITEYGDQMQVYVDLTPAVSIPITRYLNMSAEKQIHLLQYMLKTKMFQAKSIDIGIEDEFPFNIHEKVTIGTDHEYAQLLKQRSHAWDTLFGWEELQQKLMIFYNKTAYANSN